jgi:oligoribonuclease (3'-5' exoribonuclease)
MTGLNPRQDELCEIAIIVTDSELNPIDAGFSVVINPSEQAIASMNEFVRKMHQESGLLGALPAGVSCEQAEAQCLSYLDKHLADEKTAPLAGNSVGTDRMFLAKYMPGLESRLHYRNVDVYMKKESKWPSRIDLRPNGIEPVLHRKHNAFEVVNIDTITIADCSVIWDSDSRTEYGDKIFDSGTTHLAIQNLIERTE